MASTQRIDASLAPQIESPIRCRQGRIEKLAQQSVRNKEVEPGLFWVMLNLPNQTSCTLYLGHSELDATLIEATARGVMSHILGYALSQ